MDVTTLLLERVHRQMNRCQGQAIIVADRPGGNQETNDKFINSCLETIKLGTKFVMPDRVALVLTTSSNMLRVLQLADVVTGCTVAVVAGESNFAPPIFDLIKPMLASIEGRIGGFGLKLYPDLRYLNLYHWLVGDTMFFKVNAGIPLPNGSFPYSQSATVR